MILKQALDNIRMTAYGGHPVDIEAVSYDKRRKKGGELMMLRQCVLARANHDEMEHGTITVRPKNSTHEIPVHVRLIMKLNDEFVR